MHLGKDRIEGRREGVRERHILDISTFAALTLFLAVFCADTLHLGTRVRGMMGRGSDEKIDLCSTTYGAGTSAA